MVLDINGLLIKSKNIKQLFNLKGKNALIIGGNKGLGQAIALGIAGAGANVCVVGRGPMGLLETAEAIKKTGCIGAYFAADVTSEEQVKAMVNYTIEKFSRVDILINSQGLVYLQKADEFETAEWQKVIDVNVKSVFLCCKYVGRFMLKNRKGKIINISSVRGFQGRKEDLAYAPSKGAVNQLTRSLAIEWGCKGINVNGIAPAFTLTNISKNFLKDENNLNWVLNRIPMGRLGKLDDFMGPAIFLASEASNFINGHILPVDGGWLAT
jgi:NAD(P)-dependent dehydrogenase (short-subunit alcohol dehydrogenase family)